MSKTLIMIFCITLIATGPAWAESLMDIKVEELGKPTKPKWGKDPFMRLEDRKGPVEDLGPKNLFVEGIISDKDSAMAIINGGFFRKGDIIDAYVIKDIHADTVILERNGKEFSLRVRGFSTSGPSSEVGQ